MAITYKIHPAIGIARVGNSPDEFYIGPERPGERPNPPGGFKDAQCRVKRQAARFRVFAHHDDGTAQEVSDLQAQITWTVHLANKKASFPGRGNNEPAADITIDPGPRTATGPDQRHLFDTGSIRFAGQAEVKVPLGEMRTDDNGRLLVLGGAGTSRSPAGNFIGDFWANPGWYDDVADGPVTATITLRDTGDAPTVAPAWVIVGPPKFAPQQDSPTTLYDRVLQEMISRGLHPAPTTTSYTEDIHPVLQRARDMRWVEAIRGAHQWTDPVTSPAAVTAIVSRVTPPGGGQADMPRLWGADAVLTETQYGHLQRWQAGNYTDDWQGAPDPPPDVTPEGLDRSALEAAVGAAFFPGIEAGGLEEGSRPILEKPYTEAFRLDHAHSTAGDITAALALPWQADFKACNDLWWPVPRPNDVFAPGASSSVRWERGAPSAMDMVQRWHSLGFVVEQGDQKVEVERCDQPSVTLLSPRLNFIDVPQGPMAMVREMPLAITFEVISPGAPVTLEYAPGAGPTHPQLVAVTSAVTVGPTNASSVGTARLWLVYRTGAAGSAMPTQLLTVRNVADSTQTWDVTVDGNTVPRRTTASALVLDRSGSMAEDRGDGQTKHVALQQAANVFVDLALAGDGISVVRYNEDAQVLQPVLELGGGGLTDFNRAATHDVVNGPGLDPGGATSIGDGIWEGHGQLRSARGAYDATALVVLTDGVENSPRWISDVADQIDATTYAVGLGTPQNTSAPALQALSGNTGGYLLVTGTITADQRFLLQKYFLHILSGISNTEIVLDPEGELRGDEVHRIPFTVSDADSGLEIVLLTEHPNSVDFRLQTPNGFLVEPWRAQSEPTMAFHTGDGLAFYRFSLPAQLLPGRFDQEGTWHALLALGRPRLERSGSGRGTDPGILRGRPPQGGIQQHRRSLHEHERAYLVAAEAAGAASAAARRGETAAVSPASTDRRGLPYSLVVHAHSDLTLRAHVEQTGHRPGDVLTVSATVAQSALPVAGDTTVWVEITPPDGPPTHLDLRAADEQRFEGRFTASVPGLYRLRIRARGHTRRGLPWERERTLTAGVWRGGSDTRDLSRDLGELLRVQDRSLGSLLSGLLRADPRLVERLTEGSVDIGAVPSHAEERRSADGEVGDR
ncbi:LodA/GoxA family CTQ-dependent oxidase [Kocuria sp. NPDC057446]|uniref:LodA/GoxA family CTQ-dependent oxidase n=1 Tax=Kocuria sp. NPDC057446 TaxID=3346137 RepID=UPI0036BED1C3